MCNATPPPFPHQNDATKSPLSTKNPIDDRQYVNNLSPPGSERSLTCEMPSRTSASTVWNPSACAFSRPFATFSSSTYDVAAVQGDLREKAICEKPGFHFMIYRSKG
jgi:hypothetical protein